MKVATRLLVTLGACVTALGLCASVAVARGYTITDLGTLGGSAAFSRGLNEAGWVVGMSWPISEGSEFADFEAFLYDGTGMRSLGLGRRSVATAVNGRRQIVGHLGDDRGFLLDDSGLRGLGSFGGSSVDPRDINDAGQVVGGSTGSLNGQLFRHMFLYEAQGIHDLGDGFAYAINESGQIVGDPYSPTLGGFYAEAHDINDLGHVVGASQTSEDISYHAFVKDAAGTHDLGRGYARGINNKGQVVGSGQASIGSAFLWDDGVMTDLQSLVPPDSGWRLDEAQDINESGQIVGWGRRHEDYRAFLLTPERPDSPQTTVAARTSDGSYDEGAWTNDDVTLGLSATGSDGAGIRSITYSTWGGERTDATPVKRAHTSFTIAAEGRTTAGYHALDKDGHVETTKSFTVQIDKTAPLLTATNATFATRSQLDTTATPERIPFKVTPSATDPDFLSGVARYRVQLRSGDGDYADVPDTPFWLQLGTPYQLRVRAKDGAGNWSDWRTTRSFTISAYQDSDIAVAYSGEWRRTAPADAYGGSVHSASTSADMATLTFKGRGVSWVATRDRDGGLAAVYLDGNYIRTVDLYSRSRTPRQVVFSRQGLSPSMNHTIEVRVLGTKRAAATSTTVDVDSFLVLR